MTDYARLKDCPYLTCYAEEMHERDGRAYCATCGREVWRCPQCQTWNRALASRCRYCGCDHAIEGGWRQAGFDVGRSHFAHGHFDGDLTMTRVWFEPQGAEAVGAQPMAVANRPPAPIVAGDLVVYYDAGGHCFKARAIQGMGGGEQAQVWRDDIQRDEPLNYASSPVQVGPYMYYVASDSGWLYRTVLDSGARRVCDISTPAGLLHEVPGRLYAGCPPLLLESDDDGETMCLLTKEGLLLLYVGAAGPGDAPVRGRFFPAAMGRAEWTQAVSNGRYLAATAEAGTDVLLVDLWALPERLDLAIRRPRGLEGRFDRYSPCVVPPGQGAFYWCANDSHSGETAIVGFEPAAMGAARTWPVAGYPALWDVSPVWATPVTNGDWLYVPGLSPQGRAGLSSLYLANPDQRGVEFRAIGGVDYTRSCAFVERSWLLMADTIRPSLLHVYQAGSTIEAREPGLDAYEGLPTAAYAQLPPVVARGHVFIQCATGMAAYEIS